MGKTTTCKAYLGESMGLRRQYCKNSRLITIEMQVSNIWHLLHLYPIVFLHLFSIDIDFSFAKSARFYPNLVATFSFWFGRNLVAFRQLFQFARGGCAAKVVKGCIFLQDNNSMLVNPVGGTLSNVLKNNFRNFFCCYLFLAHHQMLLNAYFLRKLFFEHYYHCFTSKKIISFRKKKIIIRIENQPSVQRYAPHNRYSCPKLNQWSKHIPLPRAKLCL